MNPEKISVSWVSFNNDPYRRERDGSYSYQNNEREAGPTLEFLLNPGSPVAGQIKKHYLLVRHRRTPEAGGRDVHPSEVDVAKELMREIDQQKGPKVELVYWDTDVAPTDHQELFRFTAPAPWARDAAPARPRRPAPWRRPAIACRSPILSAWSRRTPS